MKNQWLAILIGVGLVVFLVAFSVWVTRPPGASIKLEITPEQAFDDPSGDVYRGVFSGKDSEILFFFFPANTMPLLRINDQDIFYHGYRFSPTASLQSFFSVRIPMQEAILSDHNTVEIRFQPDETVVEPFPDPIVMTASEFVRHDWITSFINLFFSMYATGSMLLMGFILFFLGRSVEGQKRIAYLLMAGGIASASIAIIPSVVESIHALIPTQEPSILIYYFRYLGFSLSLVMILKAIGSFFFEPARFTARAFWVIPFAPFILFFHHWINVTTLLLPLNILYSMLILLMAVTSIKVKIGLTTVLFFLFGCITYSIILYPIFFRHMVSPPFLRDHGIVALVFFLGFLVVQDYRKLMSMEKKARQDLQEAYSELNQSHAELEKAYQVQDDTMSKLHSVIELSGRMVAVAKEDSRTFLHDLLEMAKELIPESDFQYSGYHDGDCWIEVASEPVDEKEWTEFSHYRIESIEPVFYMQRDPRPGESGESTFWQESFPVRLPQLKSGYLTVLNASNHKLGILCLGIRTSSSHEFPNHTKSVMKALGNIASSFFAFQQIAWMQESFHTEIIRSIVSILEIHDTYTKGHSEIVANIAKKIAERMGFSSDEIRHVFWVGLVHDIGKILVPQVILNKPAFLNQLEYEVIKQHPIWGYQVLKRSPELQSTAVAVHYHHEHYDGSGYPDELAGEEIPIVSRIIAVADAWSAMTQDRAHRRALSVEKAKEELLYNQGTHFDPMIVKVLLEILEEEDLKRG